MHIILIVVLLLLLLGGLPQIGGQFHNMGYGPSGLLGVILVIVIIFALLGRG